jgi:tetratricopeptide (TPR) repeat protein
VGRENAIVLVLLLALAIASWMNHQRLAANRAFRSFAIHLSQEEYSEAEADANTALRGDPENAYYLGTKALLTVRSVPAINCSSRCGDVSSVSLDDHDRRLISEGVQLYRRAIALSPSDGAFHHNLGRLYALMGESKLALESLERSVAVNPDIPLYHVSLGIYLEMVGRNKDSLKEYLMAVELSPSLLDSEAFLDFQIRHRIESQEIVAQATKELEANAGIDDPIQQSKLNRLYLYAGRKEQAYQSLFKTTKQLPTLSRPWIYLGDYYQETGEWRQMLLCYQRAVFLGGDDFVPWLRLGDYYDLSGQSAPAIAAYQRALFAWSNQSSIQAERAGRIYRTLDVVRDDILPKGFLAYCAPRFDVPAITRKLATLRSTGGDIQGAPYSEDDRSSVRQVPN